MADRMAFYERRGKELFKIKVVKHGKVLPWNTSAPR